MMSPAMRRPPRIVLLAIIVAAVVAVAVVRESARDGAPKDDRVASAEKLPRLVDLGSTTCIPCKMMAPILDELKQEYAGRMSVEVIDVKTDRTAATSYGIRVIPTQIFIDATGREIYRHQGFFAKEEILAKWKDLGIDLGS